MPAITYKVWRYQCDPETAEDPIVQRFGQKYSDGVPVGGPMDLKLKDRPQSSFANIAALTVIDATPDTGDIEAGA